MLTMPLHHSPLVGWLNLLLASVVQFTAGLTFYIGSYHALKNKSANMDVLVALGTSAAYFYSLFAFFGFFGPHGEIFFETSAMLIAFIRLGKYLEARARGKAGEALKKLLKLQADKARLVQGSWRRAFQPETRSYPSSSLARNLGISLGSSCRSASSVAMTSPWASRNPTASAAVLPWFARS